MARNQSWSVYDLVSRVTEVFNIYKRKKKFVITKFINDKSNIQIIGNFSLQSCNNRDY